MPGGLPQNCLMRATRLTLVQHDVHRTSTALTSGLGNGQWNALGQAPMQASISPDHASTMLLCAVMPWQAAAGVHQSQQHSNDCCPVALMHAHGQRMRCCLADRARLQAESGARWDPTLSISSGMPRYTWHEPCRFLQISDLLKLSPAIDHASAAQALLLLPYRASCLACCAVCTMPSWCFLSWVNRPLNQICMPRMAHHSLAWRITPSP